VPDVLSIVAPGIYFHSDFTHVALYLIIASIILKMAVDAYIVLYDIIGASKLDEARKNVDDLIGSYLNRPDVLKAGVTEVWVRSFFFKQPAAAAITAAEALDVEELSDEESD